MKLYITLGGWEHENEASDSVQVFTTREAAEGYGEDLVELGAYHYFTVEEREVCA